MAYGFFCSERPSNELGLEYGPDSYEKKLLKEQLKKVKESEIEIPLIIGGMDLTFVHQSADVDLLVAALIRGAFEYQGQKCSATSRGYIPESLWLKVKDRLLNETSSIKIDDVEDFANFMGAVIAQAAFNMEEK